MSPELVTGLVALVAAVGGVLTTLFVKGRLGDVIVAKSAQTTTAVDTMARILEKTVDGLVQMASAVERIASETAGHRTDSNLHWQSNRELLKEILQFRELLKEILQHLKEIKAQNEAEA